MKWHEIYFCVHEICMHVHAAECNGIKFISVCMQVAKCGKMQIIYVYANAAKTTKF